MIAYFDTSAIVPLLLDEPGTSDALEMWNSADRVVTCALTYPEGRAAVGQAHRMARIDDRQRRAAVARLDTVIGDLETIVIDDDLALVAGVLAERETLRGADAVHLAAALSGGSGSWVLVAGDRRLLAAAGRRGLTTLPIL